MTGSSPGAASQGENDTCNQLRQSNMNQAGYTLPELLTTMLITSMFVSIIMFFTFSYWRYGFLLEADLDTFITRLNAGDYLREALSNSSGLIIQNSISDGNTHNPDPAITSNLYWTPLHAVPGNTPIGAAGTTTPLLYFKRPSVSTANTVIMNGTQPYEDEYVLYLNGTTKQLLVRSLANPNASGNRLLTSCPPASATTACPADKVIAMDISSMDMRYFSRTGNLMNHQSITDPSTGEYIGPDYPAVEVVEFTINITKKPVLQKTNATSNSTIIRIALRNT